MVQAAADMYCKPAVSFETKAWNLEGKTVLEITVPKMETDRLISAPSKEGNYKVYIRVNDQNFIVNNIYLKAWNRKRFGKGVLIRYDEPEKVLFEYLEENESITFSKFVRITKLSKKKAENILVNLLALDLIKILFNENQTRYKLV
jgi:predicted HTH transcriptional regulator